MLSFQTTCPRVSEPDRHGRLNRSERSVTIRRMRALLLCLSLTVLAGCHQTPTQAAAPEAAIDAMVGLLAEAGLATEPLPGGLRILLLPAKAGSC